MSEIEENETQNTIEQVMSFKSDQSSGIGKIALAMSKAQGAMEGAKKDSKNPFFKSNYADLNSVWMAIRKPLSDNEIAVFQPTRMDGDKVVVVTKLVHSSGQWIESEISLKPEKGTPQGHGSSITYMRRYALAAMCGVAQEDDDGNAASKTAPKPVKKPAPKESHKTRCKNGLKALKFTDHETELTLGVYDGDFEALLAALLQIKEKKTSKEEFVSNLEAATKGKE